MDLFAVLLTSATICFISLIVYRLYFHPVVKVPGKWLAALTSWHEFYYDCLKGPGGQHAFKIRAMHDQYGEYHSLFLNNLEARSTAFLACVHS